MTMLWQTDNKTEKQSMTNAHKKHVIDVPQKIKWDLKKNVIK